MAMKRGGTKQLVQEPNIPVNNNTGDISNVSVNRNLDTGSEAKHYDTKMPSALSIPPVLNIDSQNYMIHVSSSSETRPRSFSFTNGATKTNSMTINNRQLMLQNHYHANKNPLDLDMFCVKETVNSLAAAVLASAPKTNDRSISSPSNQASNSGCSRALSFHNMMCSCNTTCCCLCAPDCHACYSSLCDVPQLQKVSSQ